MTAPACLVATAPAPGAIGIIQLHGPGAADCIERLTGRRPDGRVRLADLAGVDEGLVVSLRDDWCQIMPHGGPRVITRLVEQLGRLGAVPTAGHDACELFPEAASRSEADMLQTLATAASPAAIDPLLDQPRRWRRALATGRPDWLAIQHATDAMRHLLTPPRVALIGRPNVGKSTLTNLVLGRIASITADLPGTTRDWVGGLADLPTAIGDLVVEWIDTPGLHASDDPLERRAIELARDAIAHADLIIAVRDPQVDWPDDLPDRPTLHVCNKADLADPPADPRNGGPPIPISALRGDGLEALGAAAGAALGLGPAVAVMPWAFSPTLGRVVADRDVDALARYLEEL